MKFDNDKVNFLLDEMEVIANNIKAICEDFHKKLAEKEKKAGG